MSSVHLKGCVNHSCKELHIHEPQLKAGRVQWAGYSLHPELSTQPKPHWILWELFCAFLQALGKCLNDIQPRISFPCRMQVRVPRRGDRQLFTRNAASQSKEKTWSQKKIAPNILQIWFSIRKVISQLCIYTIILCRKKIKKLKALSSYLHKRLLCCDEKHLPPFRADSSVHLHCALSPKCTGTWSGGTWFGDEGRDFYRENRVVGAQGKLWSIAHCA